MKFKKIFLSHTILLLSVLFLKIFVMGKNIQKLFSLSLSLSLSPSGKTSFKRWRKRNEPKRHFLTLTVLTFVALGSILF
jgi:hypothetical protein